MSARIAILIEKIFHFAVRGEQKIYEVYELEE